MKENYKLEIHSLENQWRSLANLCIDVVSKMDNYRLRSGWGPHWTEIPTPCTLFNSSNYAIFFYFTLHYFYIVAVYKVKGPELHVASLQMQYCDNII